MSRIRIASYMNFLPSPGLHDPGYNNGMRGQSNGSEETSRPLENYDPLPGTGFAPPGDLNVLSKKSKRELHRGH